MASQPSALSTPNVTILTYPDCSSSSGTLKIVKSVEPLEEYGLGYEFSNNNKDWVESPVFSFTAGAGYSLHVRKVSDITCVASTSCQGEGSRITSQTTSSIQTDAQPKTEDQLTAYPVPFSQNVTLEFKAEQSGKYEINLYDMKGQLVRQLKSGTAKAGEVTQIEVDGRSMADGMYLARMVSGSGSKTVKLLKKNN
ncbi:T9SS type A sorting domain-containing protein [Pontibacter sp. SD6]|uniref:T9SS type A sorting domain-containing protein n=2 Tax=Pontibacter cellulosilyticus TaxID=1720253 RepID=A0A923SIV6_9BACT|nr:T9SS type A sorting domain-containing protein [Pontibacter cellulosilyticus]